MLGSEEIKRKGNNSERYHSKNQGEKRYKGVTGSKWQTSHRLARMESLGFKNIEPGDKGIWATCTRGMEGKGTEEILNLFDKFAEKLYGIGAIENNEKELDKNDDGTEVDIEASIRSELASLKDSKNHSKPFQPVFLDLQCVLFFKVTSCIDPLAFVDGICKSIESNDEQMKCRYIQRLTPASLVAKATEKGVEELSRQLLSKYFNVNFPLLKSSNQNEIKSEEKPEKVEKDDDEKDEKDEKKIDPSSTYSIRPTFRSHNTLKRDPVIKKIASYISDSHKVNLNNPDKVIIFETYRNICSMSVVDGKDWERLKRYNIAELYSSHIQSTSEIVNE